MTCACDNDPTFPCPACCAAIERERVEMLEAAEERAQKTYARLMREAAEAMSDDEDLKF